MARDLLRLEVPFYIHCIIHTHKSCYVNHKKLLHEINTEIYITKCWSVILQRSQFGRHKLERFGFKNQLLKTSREKGVRCSRLLNADISPQFTALDLYII
jgi:hypothetical protein